MAKIIEIQLQTCLRDNPLSSKKKLQVKKTAREEREFYTQKHFLNLLLEDKVYQSK